MSHPVILHRVVENDLLRNFYIHIFREEKTHHVACGLWPEPYVLNLIDLSSEICIFPLI